MTAEDKRDRRQARHEVAAVLKKHVTRRWGLCSTGAQLRSYTRTLTDRYYAETINPAVKIALSELEAPK